MKRIAGQYAEFLRKPRVATLVVVALLSRMPIGMVGFAMLMVLRENLGSFALAGSAVGAYFVAMAVAAPIGGRLIDRIGPRIPLLVTGCVQPVAMAALLASVEFGLGFAFVAVPAALSGAFAPPITVLTCTLFRHRFELEVVRLMAFSIDAITPSGATAGRWEQLLHFAGSERFHGKGCIAHLLGFLAGQGDEPLASKIAILRHCLVRGDSATNLSMPGTMPTCCFFT